MIVTTRQQQQQTANAAKKVGGYDELVRLSQEFGQTGGKGKLTHDPKTGKWRVSLKE